MLTLKALPTDGRMFALFTCIMSLLMLAFWRASITSTFSHLGCTCPIKRLSNLGIDVSLVAAVSTGVLGVPPEGVAVVVPAGCCCCCWSTVSECGLDGIGPIFELSMEADVMGFDSNELAALLAVCTCVVSVALFATAPVVVHSLGVTRDPTIVVAALPVFVAAVAVAPTAGGGGPGNLTIGTRRAFVITDESSAERLPDKVQEIMCI